MFKKIFSLFIAILLLTVALPTAFADSIPSVKADKSSVSLNGTVTFTVITSTGVKKLQAIVDGKTNGTYTRYTQKNSQRSWKVSIKFNKTGNRRVQFKAFTASGKTTIPKEPVYIAVQQEYSAAKPSSQVITGEAAVFTVTTPSAVRSLSFIVDGKAYAKTAGYKSISGNQKTWEIPIRFTKSGTRSVYFAAYNSKGSRLKKFPTSPLKVNVKDAAPKITLFQAKDAQVVPFVEGDPTFVVNMANDMNLTLKVCAKSGAEVATLASNLKATGQKQYAWDVTDETTKQVRYPLGDYTLKLYAKNKIGTTNMQLDFSLIPLNNPDSATAGSFVVAYDMASLQASVKDDGNASIADAGFYIGTTPDNLGTKVSCGKIAEGSGYSKLLTGLSPGVTYYFCSYAQNIGGREDKGDVLSFATPSQSSFTAQDSFFNTTEEESVYLLNTPSYKYTITNPPIGYANSTEAALHMQSITVPVWKIINGQFVSATATIKVHRKLAEAAKSILTEIYNIKFPVQSIYGFNFRSIKGPQACSTLSQHSYGAAIDINASTNPNVSVKPGFIDPRDPSSPFTVTVAIADIFKKYGWDWGGNWSSNKDYMHFEYLGTPMAGKAAPPPVTPPITPPDPPAPVDPVPPDPIGE